MCRVAPDFISVDQRFYGLVGYSGVLFGRIIAAVFSGRTRIGVLEHVPDNGFQSISGRVGAEAQIELIQIAVQGNVVGQELCERTVDLGTRLCAGEIPFITPFADI